MGKAVELRWGRLETEPGPHGIVTGIAGGEVRITLDTTKHSYGTLPGPFMSDEKPDVLNPGHPATVRLERVGHGVEPRLLRRKVLFLLRRLVSAAETKSPRLLGRLKGWHLSRLQATRGAKHLMRPGFEGYASFSASFTFKDYGYIVALYVLLEMFTHTGTRG
jgi:hypothetical protein